MGSVTRAIEFLAVRPELMVALSLMVVVFMVLAARLILPEEAREG